MRRFTPFPLNTHVNKSAAGGAAVSWGGRAVAGWVGEVGSSLHRPVRGRRIDLYSRQKAWLFRTGLVEIS